MTVTHATFVKYSELEELQNELLAVINAERYGNTSTAATIGVLEIIKTILIERAS